MACPELPGSARVRIELEMSGIEAAAIDEVVAQPEFAGWTRGEWCVEIIRTALRYYVGDPPPDFVGDLPPDDRGQETAVEQEPAEQPVARQRAARPAQWSDQAAAATPGALNLDGLDDLDEAVAAASEPEANPPPAANPQPEVSPQPTAEFQPEPTGEHGEPMLEEWAPPECEHPAGARNYETGTCAACGAILWD